MQSVLLLKFLTILTAMAGALMAQPSGNCLLLNQNPIGQYVVVQHDPSLTLTNAFTIAGWAYPVNLPEWAGFICKAGSEDEFGDINCAQFSIQLSGIYSTGQYGQLLFFFAINRDTNATPRWCATTQLTSGQWSHIAAVYDGSTIKLYRNGNLETTCEGFSGNLVDNTCPLIFGADIPGTIEYWTGAFDDIAIWNKALSPADISTVKSGNFSTLTDGLVGLWRFDEGAGTVVGDTSPLAKNHGTIRGSPVWRGINPSNINTLVAPNPSIVKSSSSARTNGALCWKRKGTKYVFEGNAIKEARILTLSGTCLRTYRSIADNTLNITDRLEAPTLLITEIVFASGEKIRIPIMP